MKYNYRETGSGEIVPDGFTQTNLVLARFDPGVLTISKQLLVAEANFGAKIGHLYADARQDIKSNGLHGTVRFIEELEQRWQEYQRRCGQIKDRGIHE